MTIELTPQEIDNLMKTKAPPTIRNEIYFPVCFVAIITVEFCIKALFNNPQINAATLLIFTGTLLMDVKTRFTE